MITEIADYFTKGCGRCARFETPACSAIRWADGLAALRGFCLGAGLSEHVKWGHPCYMHGDRNIAVMGAFVGDFRLSFFNASLLGDKARVLEPSGPNASHPSVMRFRAAGDVAAKADVITAYLAEAVDLAARGIKPEKAPVDVELPQVLIDALDADPELAEAFAGLTPGRQKSYVLHINSAKALATQERRISAARDKIMAGKGFNER